MNYTFQIGSRGFLIWELQNALMNALGRPIEGGRDGKFGSGTAMEVAIFARQCVPAVRRRLIDIDEALGGHAGVNVFEALGLEWPDLFPRCLQLSAAYEGTNFSGAEGPRETADNAGVTYGCIGFTSYNGELQELIREARAMESHRFDAVAVQCLVDKERYELHRRTARGADFDLFAEWALSDNGSVREPVKTFLRKLGEEDWCRTLQMDRAHRDYFVRAVKQTKRLFGELPSARPFALLFDIGVQNGGLKEIELLDLETRFRGPGYETEKDKMTEICNVLIHRLQTRKPRPASPKIVEDVRSRKSAILSGHGEVHKEKFRIGAYAL